MKNNLLICLMMVSFFGCSINKDPQKIIDDAIVAHGGYFI